MKRKVLSAILIAAMTLSLAACGSKEAPADTAAPAEDAAPAAGDEEEPAPAGDAGSGDLITVGYAQVGAESDWRSSSPG